jgi:hypothetical protein
VSIGHPARKGSAFQPFLPSSFPAVLTFGKLPVWCQGMIQLAAFQASGGGRMKLRLA